MKKINCLFCFLFWCIASPAQKHEPVNTKTDRRDFKGYTIRLLPAASGTYGYDVLKGTERVMHQSRNPFNFSSRGLASKEDAYKLAQWQIAQLTSRQSSISTETPAAERGRKLPAGVARKIQLQHKDITLSNQRLSPKVAKQLQITITH